ncbi:hypothetical protein Ssi02_69270 [Sinosporangium siamense]|uniref:Uncharacterized protein n=1 Tax=Sinosporangium siamense TaxID=1367973 RepID=A0A919RMV5_9ACTN|nr:hypothetical protein Ssi02_69270 [Sinosporangium siamense]
MRAGRILYVGVTDAPAWGVAQANTLADQRGWTPFAALQAPYSLLNRDIERELLLSVHSGRASTPWRQAVQEVADEVEASPAQGPQALSAARVHVCRVKTPSIIWCSCSKEGRLLVVIGSLGTMAGSSSTSLSPPALPERHAGPGRGLGR